MSNEPKVFRVLSLGAATVLLASGFVEADGGGTVTNVLPTLEAFANTLGAATTLHASDVLSGTARDTNGEGDLVTLRVSTTSGPAVISTHTITAADLAQATKPGSATSGWKVWNPVADDGRVSWEYHVTYGQVGTYVWQAAAKDEGAEQLAATTVTVTVGDSIRVEADPVSAAGTAMPGARWGAWMAQPGATNVAGTNYLKVTNVGPLPTQAFTMDFSSIAFTGGTDATRSIPIDNNLQFAWWEDTTPGTTSPAEGTFAWGATSASGSITASFTGTGNVIYVTYRLVSLPAVLMDQGYGATYTVSAV